MAKVYRRSYNLEFADLTIGFNRVWARCVDDLVPWGDYAIDTSPTSRYAWFVIANLLPNGDIQPTIEDRHLSHDKIYAAVYECLLAKED